MMTLFGWTLPVARDRDSELIRVELARLEGTITGAIEAMKSITAQAGDHEARLRRIERFMYGVPLTAFASMVTAIVALLHH